MDNIESKWDRTWPQLLVSIVVIFGVIIGLVAFLYWNSRGCRVILVNASGHPLEEVTLSVEGDMCQAGRLGNNKSISLRLFPQGESGVSVSWKTSDKGETLSRALGYIESGGYK